MAKLKLLSKGLFPKELPPNFTAVACARAMNSWTALTLADAKKISAEPGRHSLARLNGTRRVLAIPNPIAHRSLVTYMDTGAADIAKQIRRSPWSQSVPRTRGAKDRAVVPKTALGDLPLLRARNRSVGHFVLLADISDFYRSVYTHSIPWVIHTKSVAKSNQKNYALLGNLLDLALRNGQGRQTKGIPIGPDSSLVIAEMLAAAIDEELALCINPLRGFRYYDDYELTFDQRSQAEAALAHLQRILASYELDLNPTKTAIRELPASSERAWILRIRDYDFGVSGASPQRVISFFDDVFELRARETSSYVVGYAISRLETIKFEDRTWPVLEHLLAQAVLAEPSAMPQFARFLIAQKLSGRDPTLPLLESVVNSVIVAGAPLGHSSEVAWAVWTAIMFRIAISDLASQRLGESRDSAVILLALDAESRGRIRRGLDKTRWSKLMTAQSLYDEHWLLAYEANVRAWLPDAAGDHVAADSWFGQLKASGVRFYKSTIDANASLLRRLQSRRGESYGDDDDEEDDVDDVFA